MHRIIIDKCQFKFGICNCNWHTFRFLAFHRLIRSGAGLVLTIYECLSSWILCHVHHRRDFDQYPVIQRRLWKVLWTAWVERMIKERMLSTRPKAGNNGKEDTTKQEIDCHEPSRGRVNLWYCYVGHPTGFIRYLYLVKGWTMARYFSKDRARVLMIEPTSLIWARGRTTGRETT